MKTRIIISAVLVGISAIAFAANESSELSSSSLEPGKFYGLIVNSDANIILTQGERNSVRLEGNKKELKKLKTKVENGALVISGDDVRPMNIYVSVEEINMIEINGAARLYAIGSISSDVLLLKVNGNGSMKVDVRALTVGMIVRGSGKIVATGSTGESFSRIYGNGNIYSDGLDSFTRSEERVALNENKPNKKSAPLKLHQ